MPMLLLEKHSMLDSIVDEALRRSTHMLSATLSLPHNRPTWRGRLHTWAFLCSLPAGVALLLHSHPAAARTAAAIYAVSVAALFGTSASYHRLAKSPAARRVMRRLDHSMIYVLIAGTYTPLCLLVLPRVWGIPLLSVIWTAAVVGIVLNVFALERFAVVSSVLYLAMGWAALIALPVMASRLEHVSLGLLIVGGLVYTVGAVVFLRKRPDPSPMIFGFHEVWHACTVVAGASHFAMVWMVATHA